MRLITSFIFIFMLQLCLQAQTTRQKAALYAYNGAFMGVSTGLGRAINRPSGERFMPSFWKGFKYGCLGSVLTISGKELAYQIAKQKQLIWGWPARIVHSYGASISENAIAWKAPFTSIRMPIGFVMLDADFESGLKVEPKLMPFSFTTFWFILSRNSLDLDKSLRLGAPYFRFKNTGQWYGGYAVLEHIAIKNGMGDFAYKTAAHELIHTFQNREYFLYNRYFDSCRFTKKWNENQKAFPKFAKRNIYLDIPWFVLPYRINNLTRESYFGNWFEMEAEHFSTNRFVSN